MEDQHNTQRPTRLIRIIRPQPFAIVFEGEFSTVQECVMQAAKERVNIGHCLVDGLDIGAAIEREQGEMIIGFASIEDIVLKGRKIK